MRGPPIRSIVIQKAEGQKVGLDLDCNAASGKPALVKNVHTGYAAERCGVIFPGDEVVSVGGVPTSGLSKDEVYGHIRAAGNTISMELDGTARLATMAPATQPAASSSSSATSSSSIARHPKADETDTRGVLGTGEGIPFTRTSFRVQFGCVARKNRTMLRRQMCTTCCFVFLLPALFLTVYVALKYLPTLLIGGGTYVPGVQIPSAYPVDYSMTNPNLETLEAAREVISNLALKQSGCLEDNDADRVALRQLGKFGRLEAELCAHRDVEKPGDGEKATLKELRAKYQCDAAFWDYLYPKFDYYRNGQSAEDFDYKPNVTLTYNGVDLTREVTCEAAYFAYIGSYCQAIPLKCPDPGELATKKAEYGCSDDAAANFEPYTEVKIGGANFPVDVANTAVKDCLSDRYFCTSLGEEQCAAAPAYLNMLDAAPGVTFKTCGANDTAAAFLAQHGRADVAGAAAISCLNAASTTCARIELMNQCRKVLGRATRGPRRIPVLSVQSAPPKLLSCAWVRRSSTPFAPRSFRSPSRPPSRRPTRPPSARSRTRRPASPAARTPTTATRRFCSCSPTPPSEPSPTFRSCRP